EKNQDLEIVAFLFVGDFGGFDYFGQGRAAHGNDSHVQRFDALPKRLLVECERTLQKRRSRERRQGEPVVPGQFHQVQGGQFRAPAPPQKPRQQRHGHQQQPKHLRIGKSHFLFVVCCQLSVVICCEGPPASVRQATNH